MNRSQEKGSISIAAAIMMVAIFGFFIASVSYSQFLSGYTQTREAASNTSRIGAQKIDFPHLSDTGERRIDVAAARQVMQEHIRQYPNAKIVSLAVTTDRIEITVSQRVTSVSGKTRTIESSATAEVVVDR